MVQKIVLGILFSGMVFSAVSQDSVSPVINFRQKFLHKPEEEMKETADSFRTLHLVIAGNIYQTERHARYAYDSLTGKYDFRNEFKYLQPILNLGDIAMANLRTSFADDVKNMFSSPDEFALALKYSGLNILAHANLHAANIDKKTLQRTRDLLNDFDMYHTGAFTDNIARLGNYPLIVNKKGFRIAVLNYTVLSSRPDVSRDFVINEIDRFMIEHDMRLAKANKPDFIIAYLDWGTNQQEIPTSEQEELARYVFEQGANLIVGTFPNAPMRLDYMNYYSNGAVHEGIVAYSMGNLIGSNEEIRNRNGYFIDMEIQKNNFTGETKTGDWGVIPVYTYYDTTSSPGKTKVFSMPCYLVESGDAFASIPYIEKRRAVNSAYEVRKLLGSTADEIQYNLNELIVNNVMESIHITNASLNNKNSPKREEEIKPSPAPVLPVTIAGSNYPPSLALLYDEPAKPKDAPVAKADKKKEKETAYMKQKSIAEEIFMTGPSKGTNEISTKNESDVKPEMVPVKDKNLELVIDTLYRIQFYALKKLLPIDTNYYTHLKGYEVYEEDGLYKYVLGKYKSYRECYKFWRDQIQPRYRQSFIVKYFAGKRVLQ